jgi:hypothetical protein
MAEAKTKPTGKSVEAFLRSIPTETGRQDCQWLVDVMQRATHYPPRMWGAGMVGFGQYHYRYPSGHEGECFYVGFSPRKQALTIYVMAGFGQHNEDLMSRLGKYKTGKCCLYVKRLDDVDRKTLKELIARSVKFVKNQYESTTSAKPARPATTRATATRSTTARARTAAARTTRTSSRTRGQRPRTAARRKAPTAR